MYNATTMGSNYNGLFGAFVAIVGGMALIPSRFAAICDELKHLDDDLERIWGV